MTIGELLDLCDLYVATENKLAKCEPFSCGNSDLDEFFMNDASLYHKRLLGKTYFICLKEDATDPKWLFHASCLTEIATGRIKLNDGKEVKFDIADSSSDEKINKAVQEALDRENLKTAK